MYLFWVIPHLISLISLVNVNQSPINLFNYFYLIIISREIEKREVEKRKVKMLKQFYLRRNYKREKKMWDPPKNLFIGEEKIEKEKIKMWDPPKITIITFYFFSISQNLIYI